MMNSESLLEWAEGETLHITKPTRHKSKHDPNTKLVQGSFGVQVYDDYPDLGKRIKNKPSIPDFKRINHAIVPSKKNAVMANAINAILATPPKTTKEIKRYAEKKEYGKNPKYLQKVKAQIRQEEFMLQEEFREQQRRDEEARGKEFFMDETERDILVDELKTKWDEYNFEYQKMTHVVILDSAGKKNRKLNLENQLSKIEKAIEEIERGQILVYQTPKF